ncbi:MAG: carbohydrate-binding protein, partial [Chitinophagaceae bacterium]
PHTTETKPFKLHSIKNGSIINAVDFDLGRNGYAYFDLDTADYHTATNKRTTGNKGWMYRNDGVDISRDSTQYEKYYVSSIEQGEWLQYTIQVGQKGIYTLKLNTATDKEGANLSILVNGKTVNGNVKIPNTGNLKKFAIVDVKNVSLNAGKQVIRILSNTGGYNFSYIQFVK